MKEIPLTQGKIAKVSDADFTRVRNAGSWQAHVNQSGLWYAKRKFRVKSGERKTVFMHRFILDCQYEECHVDHKDGDGLNNQRSNLRKVSAKENWEYAHKKRKRKQEEPFL